MRVTIAIPTRDRPQFLPLAIASALAQDYPEIEIIILDDGDTKHPELIPPSPKITYLPLPSPHLTLGKLHNAIVAIANGQVILNFDDDDWSHPHRINDQLNALDTLRIQVHGYNQLLFWDYTHRTAHRWSAPQPTPWPPGLSYAYTRQYALAHPWPDSSHSEDWHWWKEATHNRLANSTPGRQHIVAGYHPHHIVRSMPVICTHPRVPIDQLPPGYLHALEVAHLT
jgi:glycosyltransferase involved in cell wall biosynthesis